MASVTLEYGGYTFDPPPNVTIGRRGVYNDDGERQGETETWEVDGVLTDTGAALTAAIAALEAAVTDDNDATLGPHKITTLSSNTGTRVVTPVHYPVGRGQAQLSTNRRYAFTLEITYLDISTPGLLFETTQYTTNQDGFQTQTTTGAIDNRTSAKTLAENRDTGAPGATWFRSQFQVTTNRTNTHAEYSFSYQEQGDNPAFPASVTSGQKRTQVVNDGQMVKTTISGVYRGAGADSAIDAIVGPVGSIQLSESRTTDTALLEVQFSLEYEGDASGTDILSYTEQIQAQQGGQDFTIHEVIDGPPIKYETVRRHTRIRQSGSAVGLTDYPDYPRATGRLAAQVTDLLPGYSEDKTAPVRGKDGTEKNFGIAWSYEFATVSESVNTPDPITPW